MLVSQLALLNLIDDRNCHIFIVDAANNSGLCWGLFRIKEDLVLPRADPYVMVRLDRSRTTSHHVVSAAYPCHGGVLAATEKTTSCP